MVMTKEEFQKTGWKMTYEEYVACYCPTCDKKATCLHSGAFRRVPEVDGGLGLCPELKERI